MCQLIKTQQNIQSLRTRPAKQMHACTITLSWSICLFWNKTKQDGMNDSMPGHKNHFLMDLIKQRISLAN